MAQKGTKFPDAYTEFIYLRTYARWVDELGRRENWDETIDRYLGYFLQRVPDAKKAEYTKAVEAIRGFRVMPSMRALWCAGRALDRENIAGFNCSYLAVDNPKAFSEILYILMNGTGVGFSVERQYVQKLPTVPEKLEPCPVTIIVPDSKHGWAESYAKLIKHLYAGQIPSMDLSKVRPKGMPLKTFGGRASGPEPLKQLFDFTINLFKNCAGSKLSSLDAHELCCTIASVVVVGGVRRSACISLSNLSDDRMRQAKAGQFWETKPHLGLANNSVAYTERPDAAKFLEEWISLIRSGSGERGIFNREGAKFTVMKNGRRDADYDFGCNPCSEIILRPKQFCNLSEVIVRENDTLDDLKKKVRQATILGIVQSTLTKFGFLSRDWKKNTEEERLLGVSLTGLRDHGVLGHTSNEAKNWLSQMKQAAIDTAEEWAKALEIPTPAAVTCVKPSGTVSQLCNTASGLHPRYASHYVRRVRVTVSDPMCKFLMEAGVPHQPEVGQSRDSATTYVFEFPIKSPSDAVFRDEVGALEQLEYWKMLQDNWCEHKPSCTIYVRQNEWVAVGNWVYDHWNYVSGISFLPYDGGIYQLAPYEEVSEEAYEDLVSKMPALDFSGLEAFERGDLTDGAREFACVGGACEIA